MKLKTKELNKLFYNNIKISVYNIEKCLDSIVYY